MTRRGRDCTWWTVLCLVALTVPAECGAVETGFQPDARVAVPTRLDWEFVAAYLGPDAVELPADYDSGKQRYQRYVPPGYHAGKAWPLVVFISPGDDPLGWRLWQKPCTDQGLFFCAAYGAGNHCPAGQRVRIVLDVLDDVRRRYRIDPDQTLLVGFAGGARLACATAFALPEYFGGVVAIGGSHPLNDFAYLRHRVHDRLSVALVAGGTDPGRAEVENYLAPLLHDLGVRSKLWRQRNPNRAISAPELLAEIYAWFLEDLPRRQAEAKVRPGLAVTDEELPPTRRAARQLETAEAELRLPSQTWRAVALLQGAVGRWGETSAAGKARKLLEEISANPHQAQLLDEQRGEEERRRLAAEARALERFGRPRQALETWGWLANRHPDTPEGTHAATEARRLEMVVRREGEQPFLGLAFVGETTAVHEVAAAGPAERAGFQKGDVVQRLGTTAIASWRELAEALKGYDAGDQVRVEVRRDRKTVVLTLQLGKRPPPAPNP